MTKSMRHILGAAIGFGARNILILSIAVLLHPTAANAASDYYRHVFFDNSLTSDDYFYGKGQSSGLSFLEQRNGRLPVETGVFLTPPNSIRLQCQSAPEGGWVAQISIVQMRNRWPQLSGHNLYLDLFVPAGVGSGPAEDGAVQRNRGPSGG
jgi:hypothetical protein